MSGPISSSTYITSRYFGFLVLVLAHSTRCVCAPFAARAFHPRSDEKISLVCLVGQLAVRDRDFPEELSSFAFLSASSSVFLIFSSTCESTSRIDAADEEAGYARHLAHIPAASSEIFHSSDVGLGNFFVHLLRRTIG